MPLNYNGNTPAVVTYNGNSVSEVTYNGVTVWQAAPSSTPSEFTIPYESWMGTLPFYLTQSAANAVTVDWGDNTTPDNPSDLSAALSHTYATDGDYTISITCAAGETWSPGATISGTLNNFMSGAEYLTSGKLGTGARLEQVAAFENFNVMESFDFGNEITSIPVRGFRNCSSLTSIDLPAGITSLGGTSFFGCSSVASFTCRATAPPTMGISALNNIPNACPFYVPSGSVAAYQAASGWSARAAYIQAIP